MVIPTNGNSSIAFYINMIVRFSTEHDNLVAEIRILLKLIVPRWFLLLTVYCVLTARMRDVLFWRWCWKCAANGNRCYKIITEFLWHHRCSNKCGTVRTGKLLYNFLEFNSKKFQHQLISKIWWFPFVGLPTIQSLSQLFVNS